MWWRAIGGRNRTRSNWLTNSYHTTFECIAGNSSGTVYAALYPRRLWYCFQLCTKAERIAIHTNRASMRTEHKPRIAPASNTYYMFAVFACLEYDYMHVYTTANTRTIIQLDGVCVHVKCVHWHRSECAKKGTTWRIPMLCEPLASGSNCEIHISTHTFDTYMFAMSNDKANTDGERLYCS